MFSAFTFVQLLGFLLVGVIVGAIAGLIIALAVMSVIGLETE